MAAGSRRVTRAGVGATEIFLQARRENFAKRDRVTRRIRQCVCNNMAAWPPRQ